MIRVEVPGYKRVEIAHLVLDYNGTLAVDGDLADGVGACLAALAAHVDIHVVTADTFGRVKANMAGIPCKIHILPPGNQTAGKQSYVRRLGGGKVAAVGNGRNDRLMLREADLGMAVILKEGAAGETLMAADVVFTDILPALRFLTAPLRMTATLRS